MSLSERDVQFLQDHHSAAMITIARDGTPKAARVGVALVDGRLWSSGTADRVRTKRLRRDPRCTLFVIDPGYDWLALETTVSDPRWTRRPGPEPAAFPIDAGPAERSPQLVRR